MDTIVALRPWALKMARLDAYGVVEKNVQDSRRRIWIDAGNQRFGSFVELNASGWRRGAGRCGRNCVTPSREFSVAEMLEHERAELMPMPPPFDGYVEKPARVSSTCLVTVARNRYSAPCELHTSPASDQATYCG